MVAIDDIGLDGPPARPGAGSGQLACASWVAWGVTASVTVTDAAALAPARRMVARQIASIEAVASRSRPDAEIHRLYRAGGRPITISPLLAELVSAALLAAEQTAGDVDPTVNAALNALERETYSSSMRPKTLLGKRSDAGISTDRPIMPVCSTRTRGVRPVLGWQQVWLQGQRLQVPPGTTLDLTTTAKAAGCDRAATQAADRLGTGVLVQVGGNAASAGPAPDDGWVLPITGWDGAQQSLVRLPPGAGLATSRPWSGHQSPAPGPPLIDPRTGGPVEPIWQQASALGFSCQEASAYATAALVRGGPAREWLSQLWIPARLVLAADDVITTGGWEKHETDYVTTRYERSLPGPRPADPKRTTLP